MSIFTSSYLQEICAGQWIVPPMSEVTCRGIGIDTRKPLKEDAYIAIVGEVYDGHDFLADAVKAGAAMMIVEQCDSVQAQALNSPVLQVQNTRQALGAIATAYRDTLRETQVIGITGSCGKTTTRHLLHTILQQSRRGSAAQRSFNNDIGVPLTLLSAEPRDEYVLVEIGTSAPGEIDALSGIARPDIAVITTIGPAHVEGLGSLEAIAAEKASICNHLAPDGWAVVNADCPQLQQYIDARTITFGCENENAALHLTGYHYDPAAGQAIIDINGAETYHCRIAGRHNAMNIIAAIAVAKLLGLGDDDIQRGLAAATLPDMRLQRQVIGGVAYFNDAYNANPQSMAASLDAFRELAADAPGRIYVLGEMLELGADAKAYHQALGEQLATVLRSEQNDRLICIGPLQKLTGEVVQQRNPQIPLQYMETLTDSAAAEMAQTFRPGEAVLLKGSRRHRLERIVHAATAAANERADEINTPVAVVGTGC